MGWVWQRILPTQKNGKTKTGTNDFSFLAGFLTPHPTGLMNNE
jgi:hypothetical protein